MWTDITITFHVVPIINFEYINYFCRWQLRMQLVFHRPFLILCSVNTCFGVTLILLWSLHQYNNPFLQLERTIEIIFLRFHPRIKTITIHPWDTQYRLMIILSIIRMLIFILQLILTIKTTTGIYIEKFITQIFMNNFVI